MGQIRKRGAFYQIRFYRNGQRIEESTGYTKYDDARDLLKKREGAIADGVPITAKSTRLTFDDAAADVVSDYTVNKRRSLDDLERRINLHLTPAFGGRTLGSITSADARAFAARRMMSSASSGEINRELATLKRIFRLAVQSERYHGRVPHIALLDEDNVRTNFLDDEMMATIGALLPAPVRPVIRFAYITGWRVASEILPLTWAQVDRKTWSIRLNAGATKNRRGRTIDVSENLELRELLDALWTDHKALEKAGKIVPWVFTRRGKRIKNIRHAWEDACRDAGYPGRLMHDLRRSAVRNLVRAGVADTIAMKITGHVTRSVFDRYNITSDSDVRAGLGAVGTNRGDNGVNNVPKKA
jgi:integrase